MRLLELRLVEDQRSSVHFTAGLNVVDGMSASARDWLVRAVPALVSGVECGASAFVDVEGWPREVGPGRAVHS
jgi:hypothetical protein